MTNPCYSVRREATIAQNIVMTRKRGAATRLAVSLISHTLKREGFVQGRPFKSGHIYYRGELAAIVTGSHDGVVVLMFDLSEGETP